MSTKTLKNGIHNYDAIMNGIKKQMKAELSESNVKLISQYDMEMVRQSIAIATRQKHLRTLLGLTRILRKDWKNVGKSDIEKLVYEIMQNYSDPSGKETNYSYDHKKILKIFFRWMKLGSREFAEVCDPPETARVRMKKVRDKIIREDLLTEDDISRLLYACGENARDRALIDCHYEGGTRPGEILSLQIKHVKFDKYGANLHVDGKTGPRTVRLVKSTPTLANWLSVHPFKDDPDAFVWIKLSKNHYGEQLNYPAARAMVNRRGKIAHLEKRVNLNMFRHSEATNSAKFMTEAQLRKRHGWSPESKMPAKYVHMINADVDAAIFEHLGIETNKKEKEKMPKICQICEVSNAPNSTICSKCGKPLDLKTALDKEEKEKENQEFIQNQMDEMKKELEELKYGPVGRKNKYNQGQIDAPDTPEMKLITMGIPLLIELVFPEEKKRDMMREFENSELENRIPNLHKIFGNRQMDADQIQFLKKYVKENHKTNSSKSIIHTTPRLRIKNF